MRTWIENIVSTMGYFGIALVMFIENISPPIPFEVIMPFAGSLVAKGELNFTAVLISGTIGAVVGAIVIYYIGVWIEESRN
jgi:membrane protein DedA with SNARE-associated domain